MIDYNKTKAERFAEYAGISVERAEEVLGRVHVHINWADPVNTTHEEMENSEFSQILGTMEKSSKDSYILNYFCLFS